MTPNLLQTELKRIGAAYRAARIWKWLSLAWGSLALLALASVILGLTGRGAPIPASFLLGLLLFISALVLWLHRRPPTFRNVARLIETDHPHLGTLLLAAVDELEQNPTGPGISFLQERVILEALDDNRQRAWDRRVRERLFFAQCGAAASFLILLGLLLASTTLTPPPGQSFLAIGSTPLEVTPGDTSVEKGQGLVVLAKFGAPVPGEANLVMTRGGTNETVPLVKSLADPVFATSIAEVTNDFTYRIAYRGKTSRDYKVTVFEYPALLRADAELDFPAYTKLAHKKVDDTRHISAVEGTRLDLALLLNKKVASARLVGRDRSSLPLAVDKIHPKVSLSNVTLQTSNTFSLELVDLDGRTNKTRAQFVVNVLKNQRPELKLVRPRGDSRVSPLQEVTIEGQAWDDFGVIAYGVGYSLGGAKPTKVAIGGSVPGGEKKLFAQPVSLEAMGAKPDQLLSFYLYATDLGPDGAERETVSDIYFAEVRHFEEIFRESAGGDGEGGQGQQGNQMTRLAEVQKQVITATWKLAGPQAKGGPARYPQDLRVVEESEKHVLDTAKSMKEGADDPRIKPALETAEKELTAAVARLGEAAKGPALLPPALQAEQNAYEALLQLQAREFQVSQSRSRSGGAQSEAMMRQLEELELTKAEDRYEKQSKPSALQTPQQREQLEVLNRLKELAQRQQDLNDRLKDVESALSQAKTPESKAELRRQLARLREQEQEVLRDLDELRQRMDQPNSASHLAENRQQLDQTRNEVRQASEAMDKENLPQALASGTRAGRDLEQIRDKFRKQSANQFSDDMKGMRSEARELAQKQTEIGSQIQPSEQAGRKTLRDTQGKTDLGNQLAEQKQRMTNLFNHMSRVIEESEVSEPLLSKQLYDTFRQANQGSIDNGLKFTDELLKRGMPQQALQFEQRVETGLNELKQGVERAAQSILGDEVEALRLARNELEQLGKEAEKEGEGKAASNADPSKSGAAGQTPSSSPGSKQTPETAAGNGENRDSKPGSNSSSPGRGKETETASANGGNGGQGRQASNPGLLPGTGGGGESGTAQNSGSRPNELPEEMRRRYGLGPRGLTQGQSPGRQTLTGQPGQPSPTRNSRTDGGARGGTEGGGTNTRGGDNRDGGGYAGGPITGGNYRDWADRLGNVEELLDYPELRGELSRIRERARTFRVEYKEAGKKPDWLQFRLQIIEPLAEVRNRVEEELSHRQSPDALVPIDRDPVPNKFTDLVRRYYENLGKAE